MNVTYIDPTEYLRILAW